MLEAQARASLEDEGCRPCYPSHVDILQPNPPREYEKGISSWKAFSPQRDLPLASQLDDWRKFRSAQASTRHRYGRRHFAKFVQRVRDRRQRHGLDDEVNLLLYYEQQSRLQNWIEYQHLHLYRLEEHAKEREEALMTLQDYEEKSKDQGHPDYQRASEIVKSLQYRLTVAIPYNMKREENLLQWIEQERLSMLAVSQTCTGNHLNKRDLPSRTIRHPPRRNLRHKATKENPAQITTSVLAQKASKVKANNRLPNSKTQRSGSFGARRKDDRLQIAKKDKSSPSNRSNRSSKTGLVPPRTQAPSRINNAISSKGTSNHQSDPSHRARVLCETTMTRTRSGRISKPPPTWAPG